MAAMMVVNSVLPMAVKLVVKMAENRRWLT
jgi:hypothetical protein